MKLNKQKTKEQDMKERNVNAFAANLSHLKNQTLQCTPDDRHLEKRKLRMQTQTRNRSHSVKLSSEQLRIPIQNRF